MKTKILYSIIVVLLGVLVWQQTYKGASDESPEATAEQKAPTTDEAAVEAQERQTDSSQEVSETTTTEEVTVSGTYVGLRDEVGGDFEETSMYLLLDDGTEIISINLAPLVGTRKTGIESELGIIRGDVITVRGTTVDGAFVVSGVTASE